MENRQPEYEGCPERVTRRRVLRRALGGGLSLGFGGLAFGTAGARAASKTNDARIFNLALELEYTEVAFYREALRQGALRGEIRDYARAALQQDEQHLQLLRTALGQQAAKRPQFHFGARTKSREAFVATAAKLEDLAVAGYNGQATNLSKRGLTVAATIVSVEARHAAWIRAIAGQVAAPLAVDKPASAVEVARGLQVIGLRR